MTFLVFLLISIIGAIVCYFIARRTEVSTIWWPMWGFIFPILGTVVTAIVGFVHLKKIQPTVEASDPSI